MIRKTRGIGNSSRRSKPLEFLEGSLNLFFNIFPTCSILAMLAHCFTNIFHFKFSIGTVVWSSLSWVTQYTFLNHSGLCFYVTSSETSVTMSHKTAPPWLPWWLRWQSICLQCGRPRFNPWVGRFLGEGNGNLLQYSCLFLKIPWTEEPGKLQVQRIAKSQTRLSNFTFTFHFHMPLS